MSDYEALTSPAGKGIVVEGGVITSIEDSNELHEHFGGPEQSNEDTTIVSVGGQCGGAGAG